MHDMFRKNFLTSSSFSTVPGLWHKHVSLHNMHSSPNTTNRNQVELSWSHQAIVFYWRLLPSKSVAIQSFVNSLYFTVLCITSFIPLHEENVDVLCKAIPATVSFWWQGWFWSFFDYIRKKGRSFAEPDRRKVFSFILYRDTLLILQHNWIRPAIFSAVKHFWWNDSLHKF